MPNSLRDIFKYYIWTTSAVRPAISLNNYARVCLSLYLRPGDVYNISPEIVCKKKNDQVSHTLFGPIASTVGKLRTAHGVVTYFARFTVIRRVRGFLYFKFIPRQIARTRRRFGIIEIRRTSTPKNIFSDTHTNRRGLRVIEFDYTAARLTC